MSLGKGIAIAGIWLGVGLVALGTGGTAVAAAALCAVFATLFVCA
jgi:hypothetical protein